MSMMSSARLASLSIQYWVLRRVGEAAISLRMGSSTGLPVSVSSITHRDSVSVSMRDISESSAITAPMMAQFKRQPGTW